MPIIPSAQFLPHLTHPDFPLYLLHIAAASSSTTNLFLLSQDAVNASPFTTRHSFTSSQMAEQNLFSSSLPFMAIVHRGHGHGCRAKSRLCATVMSGAGSLFHFSSVKSSSMMQASRRCLQLRPSTTCSCPASSHLTVGAFFKLLLKSAPPANPASASLTIA